MTLAAESDMPFVSIAANERWRRERYPGDLKEAREAADLWKERAIHWREEYDRLRSAVEYVAEGEWTEDDPLLVRDRAKAVLRAGR